MVLNEKKRNPKTLFRNIWKSRYLYLLGLPFMVWLIVFCYVPMYGIVLAFKDYSAKLGIMGSEWVGLKHFRRIFITPQAINAIVNTLEISLCRTVFEFPAPIIIAIMITEMSGKWTKKIYQTILTFPHFLSWIVVSIILTNLLSNGGAVNELMASMGLEKIPFLMSKPLAKPFLYITSIWKEVGWGAIIYMAAIAGIDPALYEAASIDGATRIQRIWHITLTGIRTTIAIKLILDIGGMMNAGFDQIFTMRNSVTSSTVNILDTYILDIARGKVPDYGFTTAVGLFKAVTNFILLLFANRVVGKLTGEKMIN